MTGRRLFFALWPDRDQRNRLGDVVNAVAGNVKGRPVERRNWHVTLVFIGTFPVHRVTDLLERAAQINVEPFSLSFDRLEYWPRPRIACLCADTVPPELQALVDALNMIIVDLGLKPEDRRYRPHITVMRKARPFATERLAHGATTDWSGFELMESVSSPSGVRYVPLKQ